MDRREFLMAAVAVVPVLACGSTEAPALIGVDLSMGDDTTAVLLKPGKFAMVGRDAAAKLNRDILEAACLDVS